ncbi:2-amino-4-hydroxy-6-hydroxymethyldihydropteridine diphosphokinase [Altererythrobacter fulvus]|uniref:2-amino-4-hydroxy-6- hydroxymethyldihydropteridine diphosphokinase n=1 Tax=Caenibius fulvus TaxID=2126012 RepID=UPI0030199F4C
MRGKHHYLIALGSNRRHHRFGRPRDVVEAALIALVKEDIHVARVSPIVLTAPIGPSLRRYANAAALIQTDSGPHKLLRLFKKLERKFGRRTGGQRWTSRVIDLDIVLWSGGAYGAPDLTIPHRLFRERDFVLAPAVAIAPDWRDPITGLTVRQLRARLTAPRPLSR